jgi:outer membrane usher protein FimD/PapC
MFENMQKGFCLILLLLFSGISSSVFAAEKSQETLRSVQSMFSEAVVVRDRTNEQTKDEFWVPPGFEELLQPQLTEVDIHYGGFFLVSVMARFTDQQISFNDADAIINKIPDLQSSEVIRQYLKEPFATNRKLVCNSRMQVYCGSVETDHIAVIFDASRFRADIFIGQEYLNVRGRREDKYLPASDAGLSYLQNIDANVNGRDTKIDNYNIANSAFLSFRENSINLKSNIINDAGLQIDTLSFRRELNGKHIQLGFFYGNTNNLSFIKDSQFLGVTFESSLETRTDLDLATGTEIQIFLSSRSRVDIFRDGRLISTNYYNVGNQVLDTSQLSGGSYDIDIEITDSAGSISRETRFYSKTPRLPPRDQSLYFFQAGQNVKRSAQNILPESEDGMFLRGGYSKRITDNFGGTIAATVNNQHYLFETMLFNQGEYHEVQTNLAYESTGIYALDLRTRLRFMGLIFSGNIRKTWSKPEYMDINSELGQASFLVTSSLGVQTRYGAFNLFGRYNENNSKSSRNNYGLRWTLAPSSLFSGSPSLNLELSKNDDEKLVYLSASYQFSSGSWSSSVNPRFQYEDSIDKNTSRFQGAMETNWNAKDNPGSDLKISLRASKERSSEKLETRLYAMSDRGVVDAQASYLANTNEAEFLGRISTSISATTSRMNLGGAKKSESGIIVNVKGQKQEDSLFDVIVNNQMVARAEIGKPVFIALPPYQTYIIDLLPTGNALVSLTGSKQRKTLYPGNVIDIEWEAMNFLVMFGRIVNDKGKPIPNALIRNAESLALTDENGYFQAEISTDINELVIQKKQTVCKIKLSKLRDENQIVSLDDLVCI